MEHPAPHAHESTGGSKVKAKLHEELRNYAVVAAYLYICFGTVLLYETALLREEGVQFLPHGLAAVKALILGKFLLIGEALGVGSRRRARGLLGAIAWKSVLLFVFLLVLTALEELLVGWAHGRSFAQMLAEFDGQSALEMFAKCLLLLLVLIPLVAVTELSRWLGPDVVKGVLFPASKQGDGDGGT